MNKSCYSNDMIPIEDLDTIAAYLARRDVETLSVESLGGSVDVLVLLGSSLLESVSVTAKAFDDGLAQHILISGGIGHSTQDLRDAIAHHPDYYSIATEGRAEADIFYDMLVGHFDIDPDYITVENQSTNCGMNADFSKVVLEESDLTMRRLLLIQDPTMQRRTHACFERTWKSQPTSFISYAPFIPSVDQVGKDSFIVEGSSENTWSFERFTSLVLGEILRLHDTETGYGPNGANYIDHVEVPQELLDAYNRLQLAQKVVRTVQ